MSLHRDFLEAVKRLHPSATFVDDVIVQDDSDGRGPYLKAWNLPGEPPTDAEIAAAMAQPIKVKSRAEKLEAFLASQGLTVADLKAELK